jgi:predicted acylesterase/phospholipase RssA
VKRGLVLEGGGAKGAYQVGCLRAFQEHDIKFDAIAGTSIGALNGALLSSGKLDEGTAYWSALSVRRAVKPRWRFIPVFPLILLYTVSYYHNRHGSQVLPTRRSVGVTLFLNLVVCGVAAIYGGVAFAALIAVLWFLFMWLPWLAYYALRNIRFSVLTPSPLASFLEEVVTSTDTLKIPLYVTVTDHASGFDPDHPRLLLGKMGDVVVQKAIPGEYEYPNYLKINGMALSTQRDLLLASAALPLGIFPPIHVDSKEYVDGGVADNLPIFPLMTLEQCSEVVVVALRPTQEDSLLTRWQNIDRSLRRRALSVKQAEELYYSELYRRGGDRYEATYEAPHYEPPVTLPLRSPESWPEQTILIAPKRSLGTFLTGTMHFRARYAKRLLQQGYEDAIAAISTHQIGSAAQQEVFGSGQARHASQVSGVQYNYFGDAGQGGPCGGSPP